VQDEALRLPPREKPDIVVYAGRWKGWVTERSVGGWRCVFCCGLVGRVIESRRVLVYVAETLMLDGWIGWCEVED
jgi:hypothetical protein